MESLPAKLVPETITVEFNFAAELEWAEEISEASISVGLISGVDPSPEDMISGTASIAGSSIFQDFSEGLPGVVYLLTATATTASRVYEISRRLAVLSTDGAFQPPRNITLTGTLPDGRVGVPYQAELFISGGFPPYEYDDVVSGAAPFWMGFSVDEKSLVCAGTPDESADESTYTFSPQIKDAVNNRADAPQDITILRMTISGNVPDGGTGEPVSGSYTQINGTEPVSFEVLSGTFPPGVTLNSDGTYAGTFASSGDFSWVIRATDVNGVVTDHPDENHVALWRWWLVRSTSSTMYVADDPINGPWQSFVRSAAINNGLGNIISSGPGRMFVSSTSSGYLKGFYCPSLVVSGGVLQGVEVNLGTYNLNWWYGNEGNALVGKDQGVSGTYVLSTNYGETFASYALPTLIVCSNIVQLSSGRWIASGLASGSVFKVMYTDTNPPTGGWTEGSISTPLGGTGLTMATDSRGVLLNAKNVYTSASGAIWADIGDLDISSNTDARCVLCHGDLLIQSTGQDGNYFISRNGGNTWEYESFLGDARTPLSMFKHGNITVVNCATGHGVLYSIDGETTWNQLTLPFTPSIDDDICLAPLQVTS